MQLKINLLEADYTVTASTRSGRKSLRVENGDPQYVDLTTKEDGTCRVRMGEQKARVAMAVKGDTAYIRAFGRTFTLCIVNPVEQAAQSVGRGGDRARAPMPGMVASVAVVQGDRVAKGAPLMTIESMKILTVITAPRDGKVSRIHFADGDHFEKSATLVTLADREEG